MVLIALVHSRLHAGRRLYVLWVDLRTASPLLHRAILIRRLFECGMNIAFCRLALAILDSTAGILSIGSLVGQSFTEKRGVREGAVEFPHCFNAYIDGAKSALEAQHPRLCTMMGITIAMLLYADDAAIPADTAEDLQLPADIFVKYCYDYHLFITVPKTFVTVFHVGNDENLAYTDDGKVIVDGHSVVVAIYGQQVLATPSSKYLGVHLDEHGSQRSHFSARSQTFCRAIDSFFAGLAKILAYSHSFLLYLWRSLVEPVAVYGCGAFAWSDADARPFIQEQSRAWRRMLRVGGRAPTEALQPLFSLDCISLQWRVRRVALFLRLVCSPEGSLEQIALLTLKGIAAPWYRDAVADLRLILP